MKPNGIPSKKVVEFYSLDTRKKGIKTEEKIEKKEIRKIIQDPISLNGCIAYKPCDIHIYQFTPKRVNKMMDTSLKDLDELEDFLRNSDNKVIEKMINQDNLIFDGVLKYAKVRR